MNQRTQYLIQILDKIGAPLLGAANTSENDADTATIVASLLGKVVETSISMNQALDLTPTDAQDDSLRVALAALAGTLVADQYKQKGKVPEAADLTRIQSAMSAVLTFGDNFTLSDAHVERLSKLKADGAPVDAHQISIQYVDALIPVINAVGAFPFGQPEQKLIMAVSDRLVKRTAEMRETLLPGLSGDDEKLAELAILRATAHIYAACHEAETQKLTGADGDAPATLSIDPVWQAFEMRTAMLEAVAKNLMPEGQEQSAQAPTVQASPIAAATAAPVTAPPAAPETPATPPPVASPPAEPAQPSPPADSQAAKPAIFQAPTGDTPPATETPAAPPPPVAPPPPAAPETPPTQALQPTEPPPAQTEQASGGGASPMGFFAKPKDGDDSAEAPDTSVSPPMAQPTEPPAPPPAPAAPPPVEQPPAAPETPPPPPVAPPAPPPAEAPPNEGNGDDSGEGGDSGGNPMSFFGKKD